MSSDVAKSPAKSNLEPKQSKASTPKDANNEKSFTNGHSEVLPIETLSPIKDETPAEPAKEKQKTSKSNKSTKKEDTKNNHKSEKIDTNDRLTPVTPSKEKKDTGGSESKTVSIVNKEVVNDTSSSKSDQTAPSEQETTEKLPEKKIGEINNADSDATEKSKLRTDEKAESNKDHQKEENVSSPDSHPNAITDEEMPSFTVEAEPDLNESKGKGKILKLKSSPLVEKAKVSDKSKRKKKSKQIVTKIEAEVKEFKIDVVEPIRRPSSFGHISGRRSFRTLPELPARRYHYEAPKPIRNDLDNSSSSLNVTVGSEVAVDNSFSFFGFGKKREYTESVDTQSSKAESEDTAKTPKRARLDRSGILNLITTPISLLRSQFSKTSMHCSTPNIHAEKTDEDGVENVSVVDAEEILNPKTHAEENTQEIMNDIIDDKGLEEIAADALKVQLLTEDNQADVKRKGCNVM